ncbi:ATP-grasp domain-containing protein [Wukongibacter sp. M2B1]|uniref:ATP-grasp domain-containing protein n=1 Tax=Wukongibacter sp. M2B1 TaxID=3088895 RepID=UPI003D79B73B
MEKILVIGAGLYQVSGIEKLKEKEYYVIAIDGNPNALGKEISDEFFCIDIKDTEGILNLLQSEDIKIDGCICFATEIALRTVAKINERLKLKGITMEQVSIATSKVRQREILKKSNLPYPKFISIKHGENVLQKVKEHAFKYPLIIKPSDSSGSRGVFIIRNSIELQQKIEDCFNFSSFDSQIIIEELIEGIEFTIESIVTDNTIYTLAISEKKKPINNYTVSTELFYNSPLAQKLYNSIESVVNKFVRMCEFKNTIIHTEVIYSNITHEVYIIETTVRSGGYGIFDKILPKITGIDVVGKTIDLYLDNRINLDSIKRKPCILRFFTANEGKLVSIYRLDKIIEKLSDIEYDFFATIGDHIKPIYSDGSRLGYMIVHGQNWEDVYNKANILEYAIKFEISNI